MVAYAIRNQGWARSRARVRIVVSVILSVAELVLLCWPIRVTKCYPASPSRASLNLDKVFEDAKIWTAVLEICFVIFFRHTHRNDDWVKSNISTKKQESCYFRYIMQVSHIKT